MAQKETGERSASRRQTVDDPLLGKLPLQAGDLLPLHPIHVPGQRSQRRAQRMLARPKDPHRGRHRLGDRRPDARVMRSRDTRHCLVYASLPRPLQAIAVGRREACVRRQVHRRERGQPRVRGRGRRGTGSRNSRRGAGTQRSGITLQGGVAIRGLR